MARDVLIPPVAAPGNAAGSGSLQVHIALVDVDGVAVPYADVANTSTIHGVGVHTITDSEYALTLSTQDELPNETYYRVQVRQGLSLYQRDVQVPAGGDLTWAEFLGLEDPVTGGMAWASRLLPDDATDGQFATYDEATSSWVAITVAPGSGVPEAPLDGEQYARQSGAWAVVAAGTGDVEEAPEDGTPYARQDAGWVAAATASQGSLADSAVQPTDLGTAAAEDVGAFDAAGSASGAVSGHESTYDHTLIGTALQPGDGAFSTWSYTQSSHGFTAIGQPVYFTGTGYASAAADDADTIHTGVIAAIDGNDLVIQQSGVLSGITFATLTPGEFYFLADDGSLSLTEGTISAPVLQALTSSSALILPYRASGEAEIQAANITNATDTGVALITATDAAAARLVAQAEYASINGHNVLEHGVVADFATTKTDNRAALQALINLVEAAGGGVIYFPPGHYFADVNAVGGASLDPGSGNISFLGASSQSSVLHYAEGFDTNSNRLFSNTVNETKGRLDFIRLGFRGTLDTTNPLNAGGAIQFNYYDEYNIIECSFEWIAGLATSLNTANRCLMYGNKVHYCARDGLRVRDVWHTRIIANNVVGTGDDPIAVHTEAAQIGIRHVLGNVVVTDNILRLNGGPIKIIGAANTIVANNTVQLSALHGILLACVDGTEGGNPQHDVLISNNQILDCLNHRSSPYSNDFGAISVKLTAPEGNSESNSTVPGEYDATSGAFVKPWDYYQKSTLSETDSVPRDERIRILGNTIARTLPAATNISDWGLGAACSLGTFSDLEVEENDLRPLWGVYVHGGSGAVHLEISGNMFTHCNGGIQIPAPSSARSYIGSCISRNIFRDILTRCIYGTGSNSLDIEISGNFFDSDPYRLQSNSNMNGTYTADGQPKTIDLASLSGTRIFNNTFRNTCRPLAIAGSHYISDNIAICNPAAAGFSASNQGIGVVPVSYNWKIINEDSDPTSGTFGTHNGYMLRESASMPTSGWYYKGWFVYNTAVTSSGVLGWARLTSNANHVLGTDWAAINVN